MHNDSVLSSVLSVLLLFNDVASLFKVSSYYLSEHKFSLWDCAALTSPQYS